MSHYGGAESSIGFAQSEPDGGEAQSVGSAEVSLGFVIAVIRRHSIGRTTQDRSNRGNTDEVGSCLMINYARGKWNRGFSPAVLQAAI
jgi:hypothetical protein